MRLDWGESRLATRFSDDQVQWRRANGHGPTGRRVIGMDSDDRLSRPLRL